MRKLIITFILILLISTVSVSAFRLADYITGNAVVDESGCQVDTEIIGMKDKKVKTILDSHTVNLVGFNKKNKSARIRIDGKDVVLKLKDSTVDIDGINIDYTDFSKNRLTLDFRLCEPEVLDSETMCNEEEQVITAKDKVVKEILGYDVNIVSVGKNGKNVKLKVNANEIIIPLNSKSNIEGLNIHYGAFTQGQLTFKFSNNACLVKSDYCATELVRFKDNEAKKFTFVDKIFDVKIDVGKTYLTFLVDNKDKVRFIRKTSKGMVKEVNGLNIKIINSNYVSAGSTLLNLRVRGLGGGSIGEQGGSSNKGWADVEVKYCSDQPIEEEFEDEPIGLIEQLENGIRATLGLDGFGAEFEGREVFLYNVGENAVAVRVIGSGGLEYIESIILDQSKLIDGIDIFVEEIFFDERRAILAITNRVDEGPITVPNPEDEDLNADGTITEADVELWQSLFRSCIFGDNQACTTADINADTSIDGRDKRKIRDAIE